MSPVRALLTLVVAAVLVTALGGVARARSQRICELEEAMTPAPPAEALPETLPLDHRQCRPGVHADAGCWPDDQAPAPGPRVPLRFEGGFLLGAAHPPLRPGLDRAPRAAESAAELAAGHRRRVERPPRPASL